MQTSGISRRNEAFEVRSLPGQPQDTATDLIGQVFVRQGMLNDKDVDRVLAYAERRHLKFGEAAVKLGIISRHELGRGIAAQFGYSFLEPGAGGYSNKLTAAYDPFSPKGEALQSLRLEIHRQWLAAGHPAVAVIGPTGKEGSSYIAANLAVMFSQSGESVVLVDANFKSPSQHTLFRVGNASGLSAALVGRAPVETLETKLPLFRDLSLVTTGVVPPNAAELLARPELARVIADLRQRHGIVLFDAPSFSADIGCDQLARQCGGALLVIRENHTRLADSRNALKTMEGAGVDVMGTALMRRF